MEQSTHQKLVTEYHSDMSNMRPGMGMDMYLFHAKWHQDNRDPRPSTRIDPDWGTNIGYGTAFLQMHHEMVRAANSEPKQFMMHESIFAWYQTGGRALPTEWDTLTAIPQDRGYQPDPTVYPVQIQQILQQAATAKQTTVEAILTRNTDNPQFSLPRYFTREGVAAGERGEPNTGARKLADFKNVNQLGCCIVYPHNEWHGTIGGAMGSTLTAIVDPIFYFGVHWHIDQVFADFQTLSQQRNLFALDRFALETAKALPSERRENREHDDSERQWREQAIATSKHLHRLDHLI
ncbi:hypothetical protein BH11ARM2_BH11ARM2_13560 [soil metagenome]